MKQLFTLALLILFAPCLWAGKIYKILADGPTTRLAISSPDSQTTYEIGGLEPGKNYWVYVNGLNGEKAGLRPLSKTAKGGQWESRRLLSDVGASESVEVRFAVPGAVYWISILQETPDESPVAKVLAGITASSNGDAQYLIQNVFIGGGCFDVLNATSQGTSTQIGTFSNGGSSININTGVILSTGNVTNAAGPNNSPSTGSNFNNASNDPDLAALVNNGSLFDAAVIEFEFTPTISQVSFEYAFASEEYCEFAGSNFNDVFGFFISGPGINGPFSNNAVNIALIPGTNNPVAINTVNHFSNTAYYHDNNPPGQSTTCNTGEAAAIGTIAYDGFTTVLTAVADVVPCETYHIKLAIADRGDSAYDSAVFLKANSFNAGTSSTLITPSISGVAFSDNTAYEQCGDGVFTFVRDNSFISEPFEFSFTVSSSSTATPGLDYVVFPTTITFAPGQTTLQLPVEILADNLAEGVESIILEYDNPCSCFPQQVELFIYDPPALEVFVPDEFVCQGLNTTITPQVNGGAPDYTFVWSNNTTGSDFTVAPPAGATNYSVTVTDACGEQAATSFQIQSFKPTATIAGQGAICDGNNTAFVEVYFTGEPPYSVTYSVNGFSTTVNNIIDNPAQVPVQDVGPVTLVSASANGCPANVTGSALVTQTQVAVNPSITPLVCYGVDDGAIGLQVSGGQEPYSITWDNNLGPGDYQQNLEPGDYHVTVVDDNGCLAFAEVSLLPPPLFQADIVQVHNVDCNNPLGGIDVNITGGVGSLLFNWSNGTFNQNLSGVEPGYYDIAVYDANGCQATAGANIINNINYPNAVVADGNTLDCLNPSVLISGLGSSQGANISYQWLDENNQVIPGAVNRDYTASAPGQYTLIVTNTVNGCSKEASTEVILDADLPTADAGPGGEITCLEPTLTLDGSASSQGAGIEYVWTSSGGHILSGAHSLSPVVGTGGTYFLQVSNADNGCVSRDTVVITADQDFPAVQVDAPGLINCYDPVATLSAGTSNAGTNFAVAWTSGDGHFTGPLDDLVTTADSPGNYTVAVINLDNGCETEKTVSIGEDFVQPVAEAGPPSELSCQTSSAALNGAGSSQGSQYAYSWVTADGQVNSGQHSLNAMVNSAGTYTLQVLNTTNGCQAEDSVQITENSDSPAIAAAADGILTCANTSVQLSGAGSDSGPDFQATWTGPSGGNIEFPDSLVTSVDQPGIYTLSVTNLDNSCVSSLTVNVGQDIAPPAASAGPDRTLTCFEPAVDLDGSLSDQTPEMVLQWTDAAGQPIGTSGQPVVSTTLPGIYYLSVLDQDNGCSSTDSVEVLIDQVKPLANAGLDNEINCATPVYQLTGSAADTGPAYELAWTNLTGTEPIPAVLSPSFSAPGTFELKVTNLDNGCFSTDTVAVTANFNQPEASISGLAVLNCTDTQILLNSSVAGPSTQLTYSWTTDAGHFTGSTASPDASVDQPGLYILRVQDLESFCVDTALWNINQDIALPIVAIATPEIITCSSPEVTLDGSASSAGPEYEYSWSTADGELSGNADDPVAAAASPGKYTLSVLDTGNGCSSQSEVLVEQDPNIPVADAGLEKQITCDVPQVNLGGSGTTQGAGIIYEWLTPAGGSVSDPGQSLTTTQAPGTYILKVINQNNDCVALDTVVVAIDTLSPVAAAGPDLVLTCEQTGGELTSAGSSTGPGFSYAWSRSDGIALGANPVLPVNAAGTYSIEVTNNATGCRSTDAAVVSMDTLHPVVAIDQPDLLTCTALSLALNAQAQGNHQLSYEWSSDNGNIISGGNGLQPVVNSTGEYELLVTNLVNGCQAAGTVEVGIDTVHPVVQIVDPQILNCQQTSITLDAGASQQTGFEYEWSTVGGRILSGQNALMPVVDKKGTYTLTVLNPDNGCESMSSVLVEEDVDLPQLAIAEPDVLTCAVTSVTLQGSSNGNYQYTWSGPGVPGGTGLQLTVSQPGEYRLQAIDPTNNCRNDIEVTVDQDIEAPVADAGTGGTLDCHLSEVGLNGAGSSQGSGFIYSWTTAGGSFVSGTTVLNPVVNAPGQYTLRVENTDNGCSATDLVEVSAVPPVEAEVQVTPPPCYGDPASLIIQHPGGGIAPYLYSIDGGDNFRTNPGFTGIPSGAYEVVVQDAAGCEFRQEIAIEEPNELEVALDPQIESELGDQITLHAQVNIDSSEIASIRWRPADPLSCSDCLQPTLEALQTTIFSVQIENNNGCKAGASTQLIVDRNVDIFIPNGFTPYNQDGNNDLFMIFAKPGQVNKVKSLQIFNRWGELVFEVYNFPPNDPLYGWDGTHRGLPLDPAVFVYWTEVELIDGQTVLLKGDVTLIR